MKVISDVHVSRNWYTILYKSSRFKQTIFSKYATNLKTIISHRSQRISGLFLLSFNAWASQVSAYTSFHFSFRVLLTLNLWANSKAEIQQWSDQDLKKVFFFNPFLDKCEAFLKSVFKQMWSLFFGQFFISCTKSTNPCFYRQ